MTQVRQCQGLREISDAYSIFILDQWGVLHDGAVAFVSAIESVAYLKQLGKTIALISNSGKSAESNIKRLNEFGFDTSQFDYVSTSGEFAIEYLKRTLVRKRIFWIDYSFDEKTESELSSNTFINTIENADAIYLSGWDSSSMKWETYAEVFCYAAAKKIPMICSNPDVEGFSRGLKQNGPGWVADRFLKLGGIVTSIGKPDKSMFQHCLSNLGATDTSVVVVIGDSYVTDVCGAANAGIDSVLIECGVHKDIFSTRSIPSAIEFLSKKYSNGAVFPKYAMPRLQVGS